MLDARETISESALCTTNYSGTQCIIVSTILNEYAYKFKKYDTTAVRVNRSIQLSSKLEDIETLSLVK